MTNIAENINNRKYDYLLWTLLFFAVASFFTTLTIPYLREEGVYTITSLEMLAKHSWFSSTLLGGFYPRPPLYNWLILAFTKLTGLQHILIAARLSAITSTVLLAGILAWFTQYQFADKRLTLLTAVVFLSSDVLMIRGWLAYADPTFALFVFASIAFLWLALDKKNYAYLSLALIALIAAFFSKHFSAYIFYAVAALVLLLRHDNGRWLLRIPSIILHILAISFVIMWFATQHGSDNGRGMFGNISDVLHTTNGWRYIIDVLFNRPFNLIHYLMPASIVALILLALKRVTINPAWQSRMITISLIAFINYLPYWLAPGPTAARYLLPLYPLFAILCAYIFIASGDRGIKHAIFWLSAFVVVRYLFAFVFYPYMLGESQQQYQTAATAIQGFAKTAPIYPAQYSFKMLGVATLLDVMRYPRLSLVHYYTHAVQPGGVIISDSTLTDFDNHPLSLLGSYRFQQWQYSIHSHFSHLYIYRVD